MLKNARPTMNNSDGDNFASATCQAYEHNHSMSVRNDVTELPIVKRSSLLEPNLPQRYKAYMLIETWAPVSNLQLSMPDYIGQMLLQHKGGDGRMS